MSSKYGVVDLFAGPGGLAEGFAGARREDGSHPYSIELSVEMESSAHKTLRLRSFLRQFDGGFPQEYYDALNEDRPVAEWPDWSELYRDEWDRATEEALQLELGSGPSVEAVINSRLDCIRREHAGNVILIGGPPCQAYSLVGRSRNMGTLGYSAAKDHRHFLYREYIRILNRLQPAVFVMENVKGILSSKVGEEKVFDRILDDLRNIKIDGEGYQLLSLSDHGMSDARGEPKPADFIVRTEEYGVPQARHRVIVVGLRPDVAANLPQHSERLRLLNRHRAHLSVRDVLSTMPKMRSGLSRGGDGFGQWQAAMISALGFVENEAAALSDTELLAKVRFFQDQFRNGNRFELRKGLRPTGTGVNCPIDLQDWLTNPKLEVLPNNETRSHMPSDLARYFYAAVFAEVYGRSPKATEYPAGLAPAHRNWDSGKFADRFRVQTWGKPSSTVTSHISKDGHYFIHPDPLQCRSLTVREAARLQTFPDDYLFLGNRTQQYVQVGNAVPPYLAKQIAESLISLLQANGQAQTHETVRHQPSLFGTARR